MLLSPSSIRDVFVYMHVYVSIPIAISYNIVGYIDYLFCDVSKLLMKGVTTLSSHGWSAVECGGCLFLQRCIIAKYHLLFLVLQMTIRNKTPGTVWNLNSRMSQVTREMVT